MNDFKIPDMHDVEKEAIRIKASEIVEKILKQFNEKKDGMLGLHAITIQDEALGFVIRVTVGRTD